MTASDFPIFTLLAAGFAQQQAEDPDTDTMILGAGVVRRLEADGGRMDELRGVVQRLKGTLWLMDDAPENIIYFTNRQRFIARGKTFDTP